ncbi:MAG: HAMP domain-containing sensor histidine kinase [Aquabacterium sp.]|nr:HAMP domain-containing sensor histidine kinase [Aquabacterium sp.]
MTVRARLALAVLLTGLLTAAGVIATLALAFQRVAHEGAYQRADAFLARVVAQSPDLLDLHARDPDSFTRFLTSLLLFEPDSQLYLLAADGAVLAHSGQVVLAPGFKVALGPVQQSAAAALDAQARKLAPYVMGDDPERMDADAVVAARALQRQLIRSAGPVAGYLYVVCRKQGLPGASRALFQSSLAGPALAAAAALMVLGSLLAAWIIGTVTRPLRVLSDEVAAASRDGFSVAAAAVAPAAAAGTAAPGSAAAGTGDEFSRLREGFRAMLTTLRSQWDALQRMDRFRRESVSNLSHDLRSPLTATVACLETLDQRWAGDSQRADDRHLVQVALRNTRNAAGLVRSLGDLSLLDEPEFKLKPMRLDLAEVLDDIALRFAERAAQQGVALRFAQQGTVAPVAAVDVELFERAVANLLDNALKFTPAGGQVVLRAGRDGSRVQVAVADSGTGIAADELPHLFDRLYQARSSVAPATSDAGKGLGLAIVQRIVALHGGTVDVASQPGQGTTVRLCLPAA